MTNQRINRHQVSPKTRRSSRISNMGAAQIPGHSGGNIPFRVSAKKAVENTRRFYGLHSLLKKLGIKKISTKRGE